jgi:hypothetical protein
MLEALLLTAALAQPPAGEDCPARLVELLARPAPVLAGREAASRLFGEANFEAVEIVTTARAERHLTVRFRLFIDEARAVFTQPAAGGPERLEELDLYATRREIPLPVPIGAREEELTARLGEPARVELPSAVERRLVWACESATGESSVAFRFADGALTGVEWRIAPD